jgi:branched-chain amino acid aminotransferase
VPVFDHGLLYGDGVFEGIRFYRGKAFRLDAHLARLERSAAAIRLVLPCGRDALVKAVVATIAAYGLPNGYLRLIVTRGAGRLGLDPASCARPSLIAIADELAVVPQAVREHGARVVIAATRRLAPDGLDPRIKSLNYLNHILARIEASNAAADEAILLNQRGHVAEGSAENVFIVREEELLTPPTSDGALEGITRRAVLETATGAGLRWREATLSPYDLYTAEECFLTGTGAELIPVREVDGRPLRRCPGPFYARLCEGFAQLVERERA